jgi:DNA repair protein RecO (recombination protein O)
MPARVSESFVFRTYPFSESDLIVSFFTRDQGKLRGVAKRARRPKNNFGSALERLSQVRATYYQKETRELVTLSSCELIRSQFDLIADYSVSVALDYMAEVSDHLLPAAESNERFFRLLIAVLEHLHLRGDVWAALTYFSVWAVRLSGFLPELRVSQPSRLIAMEMLKTPIGQLSGREWSKATASDLRRFLVREMEQHIERKLITVPMLEAL